MFHWPVVFLLSIVGFAWACTRFVRREIASSESKTKKKDEELQGAVASLPVADRETVGGLIAKLKTELRRGQVLLIVAYACLTPFLFVHYLGLSDQTNQLIYMITAGVLILLLLAAFVVWRMGLSTIREIEGATTQTEAFYLFKSWVKEQKDMQVDCYVIVICGTCMFAFGIL